MIVGLLQLNSPAGDISAGLAAIDGALADAAVAGIDMLVMPELFLPGYVACTTAPDSVRDYLPDVCALVAKHGVALTIGLPERSDAGLHNNAVSFGRDGAVLARYSKIQLFGSGEQAVFQPGESYVTFDFEGVRFGLLVCYDIEFQEHARALKRRGAEVILVPTANMLPFVNVHQFSEPARAAENAVTVVYANYCGAEGDLTYTGLSGIIGSDGYSLAKKGQGAVMISAELPDGGWSEHGVPLSTLIDDLRWIEDS